jgi:2,4-dienoyl-CoA reductase-like NADH-dependent reductase (Old Yellow Enzyme family)
MILMARMYNQYGAPMHLYDPYALGSITLKNRIVVSPMSQYSSVDGFAHDWHLVHLGTRAVGGAGLVFTEAAAVSPEGRISLHDLGLWDDAHVEMLARIVAFMKTQGALTGVQLAHSGRKGSVMRPWEGGRALAAEQGGWVPVAPSALPFGEGSPMPRALDDSGIRAAIASFAAAARRARQAGFDVIEIHAAHGYLLHEFLSPLSNQRGDAYGGSFDHRVRLLREVVAAVRAEHRGPLFVRISCTDYAENGWDLDQSIALARLLRSDGVDVIDCSSGGLIPKVRIPVGPGYQVPFAAAIRAETGIATGAVGMITSAAQAEEILAAGHADLIFIGRELLRNPYLPLASDAAPWPPQYQRARP